MVIYHLGVKMLKDDLFKQCNMRVLVVAMLFSAMMAPVAVAESKWDEDGWLQNLGKQYVESGDEFGCYGMPHLDWQADPGAVSTECREYIEQRIDASKWGKRPISTYTPSGLTAAQHTTIGAQGFMVHGDDNGLTDTAWHSADDEPISEFDWFNLGRRGGSLEKGIADIDEFESELDSGGLVNMYWIGKIEDLTIRHDSEVIDMVESRNDVWFTTWGEAYSYWTVNRCNQINHSIADNILHFEHENTAACNAAAPWAWNVPVTWIIEIPNSTVVESDFPQMNVSDSNTKEGWRQEGSIIFVSVLSGHKVDFSLSNNTDYDVLGRTQFFNNKSVAFTIAGHATSELFLWAKRFDESPNLAFTWLVTPKALDTGIAWLPYAGLFVLIASVSGIFLLVKRDARLLSRAEDLMPTAAGGEDDE